MNGLTTTDLTSLKKIYSGKVRDLYEIDDQRMLMIATDRLSAFDVILPDPIPEKGKLLTAISNFWFDKLKDVVPNHLTGDSTTWPLRPITPAIPHISGPQELGRSTTPRALSQSRSMLTTRPVLPALRPRRGWVMVQVSPSSTNIVLGR